MAHVLGSSCIHYNHRSYTVLLVLFKLYLLNSNRRNMFPKTYTSPIPEEIFNRSTDSNIRLYGGGRGVGIPHFQSQCPCMRLFTRSIQNLMKKPKTRTTDWNIYFNVLRITKVHKVFGIRAIAVRRHRQCVGINDVLYAVTIAIRWV